MAQSPEYPDLKWIPPKSWTKGRPAPPRVIIIHTTEGHEHFEAAENGAAYDQRRTDGTSTHYFHDPNSTVQCVHTKDQAHAARRNGNKIGIQHELCGKAGQSDAQWDDANSNAIIRRAAKQAARDAKKYNIPVVKLTPAQVRAGARGFCGHVDITYAYPEDNGDHTDPGPRFPWAEFLAAVKAEMEEDVALTTTEIKQIAEAVWAHQHNHPTREGEKQSKGTVMQYMDAVHDAQSAKVILAVTSLGTELGKTLDVDEEKIVANVLAGLSAEKLAEAIRQAGLTPEAIADMIPEELGSQVIDALGARLTQ